jgi:hypothetical protein
MNNAAGYFSAINTFEKDYKKNRNMLLIEKNKPAVRMQGLRLSASI